MNAESRREIRPVVDILVPQQVFEGAGVKLKRVFGSVSKARQLDPFLLLDWFGSDNPEDYLAGFPWHPHRGIETVTYMLEGSVEHGDSLGNGGVIGSGDVQWMTAGSGIVHQEMPRRYEGTLRGFQLWVNLPAARKMMDPRYRDIAAGDIASVSLRPGVEVKVISGYYGDASGAVYDLVVDTCYLDITQSVGLVQDYAVHAEHCAMVMVYEGSALFGEEGKAERLGGQLGVFGGGDVIRVQTDEHRARFLLLTGRPLGEPIAWRGPIVMNSDAELDEAFREYSEGTFLKHARAI